MLQSFFSPQHCSLKICGVTTAADAHGLIDAGVAALGVNFWPLSKRFISPDDASSWLLDCRGKILRVGVFVNAEVDYMIEQHQLGLIDVVQMHGDETPANLQKVLDFGIPCIKALGVNDPSDLAALDQYSAATAILLDTAAPGVYGGTGESFDWALATKAKLSHPDIPFLLAGGITPDNAASAVAVVSPAAIDIASGAEISPGVKDFAKIAQLQVAVSVG